MKSAGKTLLTFFICLCFTTQLWSTEVKIAKVNLALVVSLHPQMSLFDFSRMGFFKIPPGLSEKDFQQKHRELLSAPISPLIAAQEAKISEEVAELNKKVTKLSEQISGCTAAEGEAIEKSLIQTARKSELLSSQLLDLKYQRNCPDLSSPDDTRAILRKIESEVMNELSKIATHDGYSLVLNSSVTVPFNYPQSYSSNALYGLGVPGIDFSLFYSFLANKDHTLPSDDTPESRRAINWLELANSPKALNQLPLKPYPLVLEGGTDISKDLVLKIYEKHKIEKKVVNAIASILDIIEKHSKYLNAELGSKIDLN